MSTALVSMQDMQQMAKAMASSGLFGVKTPDQALALMLVAQAQGISPATACVDFDVIQGKPAMTARAMLARFQQAGGVIKWLQYTDDVCEAAFTHAQCPDPIVIKWTMEDAKRAGLTGKDNWRKYPRQMLSSRVMSEGVDRCYPAASGGFYPPEVVQDFGKEKNITPSAGIEEQVSDERRGQLQELADKVKAWMAEGSLTDAFLEIDNAALPPEEKIYIWTLFDSKIRRQLKEEGERQRVKNTQAALPAPGSAADLSAAAKRIEKELPAMQADTITAAQKKRLEAIIAESKVNRDEIKAFVKSEFGKEHFTELTKDEYDTVEAQIGFLSLRNVPVTLSACLAAIDAMTDKPSREAARKLAEQLMFDADIAAATEAYNARIAELKAAAKPVTEHDPI